MKNVATISMVTYEEPFFGDHVLVIVKLNLTTLKDWKENGTKENGKTISRVFIIFF